MSDMNPQIEAPLTINGQADPKIAEQNALKALDTIWKKNAGSKLHDEFAKILAFLTNNPLFEKVLAEVEQDIEKEMVKLEDEEEKVRQQSNNPQFKIPNKLTSVFHKLFGEYGSPEFPKCHNVVLVGSSGDVFGGIISNGMLFKDGTGPGHGEHSHTIQWLVMAKARSQKLLETKQNMYTLYCASAGPGTLGSKKLLWFDDKGQYVEMGGTTYWNFLVDCFSIPSQGNYKESGSDNILSSSYRSPGFLSKRLREGQGYLSKYLHKRLSLRDLEKGEKKAERMRAYHIGKQKKKQGMVFNIDESISANLFIPKNAPSTFLEDVETRLKKLKTQNSGLNKT